MNKYPVRVNLSGQQSSCTISTSWTPHFTTIGLNKIQILQLENPNNHTSHYVSVNSSGTSPKSDKFFKINGNFGKKLKLGDGEEILATEITQVPILISSAVVSCVCLDDWEILESNADIVTNSLLHQLRVVYPGLEFPFWVTKSMTINLKIDKIYPEVEYGILDSNSEIIIPSITNPQKLNISVTGILNLRLHPCVLFSSESEYFVPSVSLLFSNIRHAFTYKACLNDLLCENDRPNSFFFLRFVGVNSKLKSVLKVFLLDNLDVNEQILRKSFPLTNPPALYLHPKFVENSNKMVNFKSFAMFEQTTEEHFIQIESQHSPLPLTQDRNNSNEIYVGFEQLVKEGCNFLKSSLSLGNIRHGFIGPTSNLLITGREGSGKTALALKLIQDLAEHPYFVHSEIISCPKLRGKKSESVEKHLSQILASASQRYPSIVVLDDLDALTPTLRVEQQNLAEEFQCLRISETILDCLKNYEDQQIVLIVTARGTDSLSDYWKNSQGFHFFAKNIYIPPPNQLERLEIFQAWFESYQLDACPAVKEDIRSNCPSKPTNSDDSFATMTKPSLSDAIKISLSKIHDEFSSPLMIRRIAEKWALHLFENEEHNLSGANGNNSEITRFGEIISEEIMNAGGGSKGNVGRKVNWNEIGGLKEVKEELTKILEWPIKYPKLFENAPVKLTSGILFYGFPGSGKTLLALAVPSIVNAKFIHIKGPELLSKYIGASEQAVKDLFQRAKDSKPCILFFDEFDSLVPRRGHDSTGVTDRVVNQFLAEMDGVDGGMGQGVHLIAATSRPDLIDPAILRPGRLDKLLFFPMPTKEERVEIVKRQSEQMNLSDWSDEDWDLIGRETEGFTGADLHSLLFSAQMTSIQKNLTGKLQLNETVGNESNETFLMEAAQTDEEVVVTMDHMKNALTTFQPSLQGKEFKKFQRIFDGFSSSRSGSRSSEKGIHELMSMSGKRATLA